MKDMSGLMQSFPEWRAVLDFLAGIKHTKDIKDIHVTREGAEKWSMKIINETDKNDDGIRKTRIHGIALYDLYW